MGKWLDGIPVLIIQDKGNYNKFIQEFRLEYLGSFGSLSPKVSLSIASTNPQESKPRSFRTDDPETLRAIIKRLIICLHRLEDETLWQKTF
jgi:hypothetical protein